MNGKCFTNEDNKAQCFCDAHWTGPNCISMLTSAPLVVTTLVNMAHVSMKKVVTDVNVILVSKVIDARLTSMIVL